MLFKMADMIQVCSNFGLARVFIVTTRPDDIVPESLSYSPLTSVLVQRDYLRKYGGSSTSDSYPSRFREKRDQFEEEEMDFSLRAKARIWPYLSHMCHIDSAMELSDVWLTSLISSDHQPLEGKQIIFFDRRDLCHKSLNSGERHHKSRS
jgi:hypothetical protein